MLSSAMSLRTIMLVAVAFCCSVCTAQAVAEEDGGLIQVPPLIAVVADGEVPIIDRYVEFVSKQLLDLDAGGHAVEFVRDPAWNSNWTLEGANKALEQCVGA